MCRFAILEAKAQSLCQEFATRQMDTNSAEYGWETFYPSIALAYDRLGGFRTDEINRVTGFLRDPQQLFPMYRRQMGPFLQSIYRPQLEDVLPKRIWVAREKRSLLRFLSFHTLDYQDNLEADTEFIGNLLNVPTTTTTTKTVTTTTTTTSTAAPVIVASTPALTEPTDAGNGWISIQRRRVVTTTDTPRATTTDPLTAISGTPSDPVTPVIPRFRGRFDAMVDQIMYPHARRDPMAVMMAMDNIEIDDANPHDMNLLFNLM